MLSDERKASLLAYCHLTELADDPDVEALIPCLYDAAVLYMRGAGIIEPPDGSTSRALYDLCVNFMVLDSWDRRDMTITGTIVEENPAFRRIFNQLKFTAGMVPESDTDAGEV